MAVMALLVQSAVTQTKKKKISKRFGCSFLFAPGGTTYSLRLHDIAIIQLSPMISFIPACMFVLNDG